MGTNVARRNHGLIATESNVIVGVQAVPLYLSAHALSIHSFAPYAESAYTHHLDCRHAQAVTGIKFAVGLD